VSEKKTILLVDDDPLICEMTQELLRRLGYNVAVVMTAKEARAAFFDDPVQFDLIMIDHILSDESGIELASDLLGIRPDVRIALYTGGSTELEDVRSRGIRAVVSKAFTREEFRKALERIFDEE